MRLASDIPADLEALLLRASECCDRGEHESALELWGRALEPLRDLGRPAVEAFVLVECGRAEAQLDRVDAAMAALERAEHLLRELGRDGEADEVARERREVGVAYHVRSLLETAEGLAEAGRLADAVPEYEAALDFAREEESPYLVGLCLACLGQAHLRAGDATRAAELYGQAVPIARELGDPKPLAEYLANLGSAAYAAGDFAAAAAHYREAVARFEEAEDPRGRAIAEANLERAEAKRGSRAVADRPPPPRSPSTSRRG